MLETVAYYDCETCKVKLWNSIQGPHKPRQIVSQDATKSLISYKEYNQALFSLTTSLSVLTSQPLIPKGERGERERERKKKRPPLLIIEVSLLQLIIRASE
jgi:hypothetical protein